MDTNLIHSLTCCRTDVDGALRRFSGNEELYMTCLNAFLSDPTMAQLNAAISSSSWDDAFTAAHALKGLAGNMGFVPLYHATGELVILIRTGKVSEISEATLRVKQCYNEIITAIRESI
ncbi:MAG: Hpt domain-containing protein [Eubacteriaceae bacterium]|nr:Hpt domain-containing protein [Eubacteriaceae bacterium]